MKPFFAILFTTLLGLALLGNAVLYWSCQVQNAFLSNNATCDCNSLVRQSSDNKNTQAIGHSPKRFFQVNCIFPATTQPLTTLVGKRDKLFVPQKLPLLAGYPAPCFRPPCG